MYPDENPEQDQVQDDETIQTETPPEDSSALIESPGEIEVPDPAPEEPATQSGVTSIGRAVLITDQVVVNVLLVVVDEELNVVGYEVPYGSQLVVVEDDSPITFGWTYIDEEFGEPVITDTTAE